MTLDVGIIGCGEITNRSRADAIHEAAGLKVGMTMDVEEWAAEDIAERYGVPHTTDREELLSNPDIDAVYISVPHHLHAPITIDAAEAGKHVFVEKPFATTVEDGRAMIEACEEAGVALSTVFPSRYNAHVSQARELIADGIIGDLVGTRIRSMSHKPDWYWDGGYTQRIESDWRRSKERSGGGMLIMNAVHDIDRLRYVTGLEAERVFAEGDTFATNVEVEDYITVTVRYANGAIGSIEASSFIEPEPPEESLGANRIYGEEGVIVETDPLRVRTTTGTALGEADTWHEVETEDSEKSSIVRYFEDAAAAIEHGEAPPITGKDGLRTLEIITGAYEAAETNHPVDLS